MTSFNQRASSAAFLLSSQAADTAEAAGVVCHGKPNVTIDDNKPSTKTVAVRDGTIVAAGDKADVPKLQNKQPGASSWRARR